MSMDIDWTNAPEWAKYAAQDANGEVYYFEEEPEVMDDVWISSARCEMAELCGINWKESLAKRTR
jgi:hypothetical protein